MSGERLSCYAAAWEHELLAFGVAVGQCCAFVHRYEITRVEVVTGMVLVNAENGKDLFRIYGKRIAN